MFSIFRKVTLKTEVDALASELHDRWRNRQFASHNRAPHVKRTTDLKWSARHAGTSDVDLANTSFEELPSDWKGENRVAAQVAVELVKQQIARGGALDEAFVERAAKIVHTKWLERAGDTASSLRVPFNELPNDEKEKDRDHMRAAIAVHRRLNRWW